MNRTTLTRGFRPVLASALAITTLLAPGVALGQPGPDPDPDPDPAAAPEGGSEEVGQVPAEDDAVTPPGDLGTPSLRPPDESFFGGSTDGQEQGAGGPEGTETSTAETTGTTTPNPAEALLSQSREDAQDRAAERDAEEVSFQEVASRFFDLKGYFRTRGDLFYKLHLDRTDDAAFAHPLGDNVNQNGAPCASGETCFTDDTIAGANLRLRLEPVIHLSSYVQVFATIDLLDNIVLGSTPEGYDNLPGRDGGYSLAQVRSPWVPLRAFSSTQVPPDGRNSFGDSIVVKRAWGEVTTPLGRIMFGRMQSQWGLGLLANGGNDIDSDYGDIADRVMWAARYLGIVGAVGMDFAGEGPTSRAVFEHQGQPYDLGQLDDVNQYVAVLGYKPTEDEQLARLRSGLPAFAGGLYYVFRNQVLSGEGQDFLGNREPTLVRRDAWAHIVDGWFQFRYERFRAEIEGVLIAGGIMNTQPASFIEENLDVLQGGGALQLEYTLLGQPTVKANRLRIGIEGGYATGDPNQEGLSPREGLLVQNPGNGDTTISAFRFDPDFNVDLILFEQILGQVSGAHYIRPWVDYTLAIGIGRSKKHLTFRLDTIYSRASEFVSTLSNDPNLGIEIDAAVTFETADNFIAKLQYGVFFPFGAFKDLTDIDGSTIAGRQYELGNAQTLQGMLAITF